MAFEPKELWAFCAGTHARSPAGIPRNRPRACRLHLGPRGRRWDGGRDENASLSFSVTVGPQRLTALRGKSPSGKAWRGWIRVELTLRRLISTKIRRHVHGMAVPVHRGRGRRMGVLLEIKAGP